MPSPLSQQVRNMADAVRDGFNDGVMDARYIGNLMAEFSDLADLVERLENVIVPPAARVIDPTGNVVPLTRRPAQPPRPTPRTGGDAA